MGKFRFTPEAIKASHLIEKPDWVEFEITKHMEKTSSGGDSINHIYIFEGRTPGHEMEGVGVSLLINEKAQWVALPLFTACNGGVVPTEGDEFDWNDIVGVRLLAYCKRGRRQDGTPSNDLVEFKPVPKV